MNILLVVGIILLIALAVLVVTFRVVPQEKRFVIYRLGRFHRIVGPGLVIIIPMLDRINKTIEVRNRPVEITLPDIPAFGVSNELTFNLWYSFDLVQAARGDHNKLTNLVQINEEERRQLFETKMREVLIHQITDLQELMPLPDKATLADGVAALELGSVRYNALLKGLKDELEQALLSIGGVLNTTQPIVLIKRNVSAESIEAIKRRTYREIEIDSEWLTNYANELRRRFPEMSDAALAQTLSSIEGIDTEKVQRLLSKMEIVRDIMDIAKTHIELPTLLQSMLDISLRHLRAVAGTIQILDEKTNGLVVQAVIDPMEQKRHESISPDQNITVQAVHQGYSIYVADTSQDDRFIGYKGKMRSELAIPLKVRDKIVGVFNIGNPWPDTFDEDMLELAELIADQVAIAIQNDRRYKRVREELIAHKQLATLGTATAAIQHRINNSLAVIAPNIGRLRRRVDISDETIREILDIIERNVQSALDYINRIQEPLKDTEIQRVDINACLREAQAKIWDQYQDRSGFETVEIIYNLNDSLPLIEASLSHITEVFHNLIENSYKAMESKGGTLTIISRHIDDWIEAEIQDTGPGIPQDIRDRIFIKPVPSRQPGEGSGLGLWLSQLLLQKYAGEIIIKEDTEAGGMTMLVRLPVSRS